MGHWNHQPKNKNDNTSDPTESAFFSNEAVGSISTALIREGIQNVLDETKEKVKLAGEPAKVKITHSGGKYAVPANQVNILLGDLIPHLQANNNGIIKSELPDFTAPMPYLLFEDFNTNGLEGDPKECRYDAVYDSTKEHNFYFFWRAYGRSGKLANKMGSWGVGKSVFPAVSKVNCFWALTIRESDKEAYLIGQSVLKTHNRTDKPTDYGYLPWGFYGKFDEENFAVPEQDLNEIKKFQCTFNLKRSVSDDSKERKTNTGLSIVMPYPKEEITAESLAIAAIQQFFFPILNGSLEIEIYYEDQNIILKKNTIQKEVVKLDTSKITTDREIEKERLLALFKMTDWVLSQRESDHITLYSSSAARAYQWRKELFENIDIENLQQRFDQGEPLSFIIPVKYQPEGNIPELKRFRAYIQKDLTLEEPENIFIRDALTITSVKSLKRKGVRGIVVIADKGLVTFFGQAEGPAHTGWHKDNFRAKYENAGEIISFVQRSLQELYNRLQMPAEGVDKILLSDLFSIELQEGNDGKNNGQIKGTKASKPVIRDTVPKRILKYSLTQLENESGFRISNNPNSDESPELVTINLAYDRPDGKPFKKYSVLDFNVKDLKLEKSNIMIETLEKNQIVFSPTDKLFELKVSGFDQKRDLVINVT